MPTRRGENWQGRVKVNRKTYTRDGFGTKREAQEWEQEKRREQLAGIEPGSLDLLSLTVEYLTYAQRYSKKTIEEKTAVCNRLIAAWGVECLVNEITPLMVSKYLTTRAEAVSNNASNKDRKNLHAMFEWAGVFMKDEYPDLQLNPVTRVKNLPQDRKPQYTPPVEDVLRVIMACTREERFFLTLYLHTGARRSEIFNCAVEDVHMDQRQVRLFTKKSKDGSRVPRYITMSDELYESLKWWLKNRPIKDSEYLIVNSDPHSPYYGKPFKVRRRFLKGLCKRAKVKPFGFHALRRYTASLLAMGHTPTKVIQEVLGHANMNTTEIYIHNITS